MQLILLLLSIKISQGLYLFRKRSSEDTTEDFSIINYYNSMHLDKHKEDEVPMLPMFAVDEDDKPVKRKNLKKYISHGKKAALNAYDDTNLDLTHHEDMVEMYDDSMYKAKFAPVMTVDGYEADYSDDEGVDADLEHAEGVEGDYVDVYEVVEGDYYDMEHYEYEDAEKESDEMNESDDESDSDSSDSDSSQSESDSSDSDSSQSESDSSDSDSSDYSDSDSSDDDHEYDEEEYADQPDYVYSYEWDDSDKQITGSDYVYSYEWATYDHMDH